MIYYYDLHIHSVLSPDADVLMTPNNIFNMAYLKKLDIIAVTDHNSCKQLLMMDELSKSYDLLFIPGIELSLKEDFHVLVYFKHVNDAIKFDQLINQWRDKTRYDDDLVHGQSITDINDEVTGYYPYDLSKNLSLSLNDLNQILKPFHHILVFAHVNRTKHSGINYLSKIDVDAIELSKQVKDGFIHEHKLDHYKILYNSDAHQIVDINEQTDKNKLELESLSIDAFFNFFKHG